MRTKGIGIATVAVLAMAAAAGAATITLEGPDIGDFYIPLKPSASGTLGDGNIGRLADTVSLGPGQSSEGYLDVWLDYSPALANLRLDSGNWSGVEAEVALDFYDLDLLPDWSGQTLLFETAQVEAADAVGSANRLPLVFLDQAWATTHGISRTDDTWLRLAVPVSGVAFDLMTDNTFALKIRFGSDITNGGHCSTTVRNTPEKVSSRMTLSGPQIPEPATVGFVVGGMVIMLVFRRRPWTWTA